MQDLTINELVESERPVGKPGFLDPDVRKRAMERSLAVRRGEVPAEQKVEFVPSKNQLSILRIALDLDSGDSVRGWFAKAGINRGAWFEWNKDPQFREWWKKEFAEGIKEYETKWVLIGLKKMSKDFRYWNEIGKKIFGFIDKVAIKEEKSPEEQALVRELLDLFHNYKGLNAGQNLPKTEVIDVNFVEQELEKELNNNENNSKDSNG